MTDPRHAAAPGRTEGGNADQPGGLLPILPRSGRNVTDGRARVVRRPDVWAASYPDPSVNYRATLFGLPLEDYRAELRRRQAEGWAAWELATRFPAPGAVAS